MRGRSWSIFEYVLLIGTVGCSLWAGRHELADIIGIAMRDGEQSHIMLVPLIGAWLLYLRRGRLRAVRYRPTMTGVAIVLAAWGMIWCGHEFDVIVLQHVGALLLILGALISVVGTMVLRQFASVIMVFAFFIPVPGSLRPLFAMPLQKLAAIVTQGVLQLADVESVRVGSSLIVNGTQVAVGEACNGMRMVFALTLVVYAFVFSVPLRPSTQRLLIVLSPIVALLCNVIRLVPTAVVYGYGSAETAEQFHGLAGWIMLPIALLMMVGVIRIMNWLELPVRHWRLAQ